jgi:ribosome biogenesis GTPase
VTRERRLDATLEPSASFDAQVIALFGRHLLIRDQHGTQLPARPFGRRLSLVCGDLVRCTLDARLNEAHVLEVRPRRSGLYRSNSRGEAEAVVANVTLLLVALAPVPLPDLFVIDRYLAAAASAGVPGVLVLNKCELDIEPSLRAALAAYQRAGYPLLECSAHSGAGIDTVLAACAGALAALVGQSGVGKSSIVRRLVPDAEIQIGELLRSEEGRHTTTAAKLYRVAAAGQLIDSPGVRDFAPALQYLEERSLGFREIAQLAPACRFADCRHMREPECAVRRAVEDGTLDARRFESYRRLRRLSEELRARRPRR